MNTNASDRDPRFQVVDTDADALAASSLNGWYAVSDEELGGVFAYFQFEDEAWQFVSLMNSRPPRRERADDAGWPLSGPGSKRTRAVGGEDGQ